MNIITNISILLILSFTIASTRPLDELFDKLLKKQQKIKNDELFAFISRSVPHGIEPPNPKIAEYETFKSDKSSNFITDGNGKLFFRQYRRLRLADVLRHKIHAGI